MLTADTPLPILADWLEEQTETGTPASEIVATIRERLQSLCVAINDELDDATLTRCFLSWARSWISSSADGARREHLQDTTQLGMQSSSDGRRSRVFACGCEVHTRIVQEGDLVGHTYGDARTSVCNTHTSWCPDCENEVWPAYRCECE